MESNLLLSYISAYKLSYLLFALTELSFFDQLEQPKSIQELSKYLDIDSGQIEAVTNLLLGFGILEQDKDNIFLASGYKDLLASNTGQSMVPFITLEKNLLFSTNYYDRLKNALLHGGEDYINQTQKKNLERVYGQTMDNGGRLASLYIAREFSCISHGTIADLGGGAGTYAIQICKFNRNVSVDVYDKEEMRVICESNVADAGLLNRIRFIACDITAHRFDHPHQGVLLSNILHLLDRETIDSILSRVIHTLSNKGLILVHDFFLDENKAESSVPLLFGIDWLINGSNFCMSRSDMLTLLRNHGIVNSVYKKMPSLPTSFVLGFNN